MPEYIEREAVLEKAYWHGKLPDFDNPYPDGVEAVDITDIDEIPAADVVAVVKCAECKKKGKKKCPLILIQFGRNGKEVLVQNAVPDDFSCSYGERRG